MIEVTQIRKSYGKKKVLSDITFQVKPGECVAIAGKNGCGKSTLMQIMAGILKPDGGELCYFGKKAAYKSSTFRRFCGYVPQENPLMEELTLGRQPQRQHKRAGRTVSTGGFVANRGKQTFRWYETAFEHCVCTCGEPAIFTDG